MGRQSSIAACVAGLSAIFWHDPLRAGAGHDFMGVWTGFDASLSSQYGYGGAAYAFSNDIDSDGLIARIGLGGGQYMTGGENSHWVDHYDLDLMAGYHANVGSSIVSLYAGGDFSRHDNSDPGADLRGTRIGAKAQIETYAPLSAALFVSAFANYSTAFNSFNASAKLAYRVNDWFSAGPQAAVLGCEGFDQVRAGISSAILIGESTELAPSVGAAWKFDENDYGFYGGINLYTRF